MKYSIETVYTCINDDSGKTVFVVKNDDDGLGLINIEIPNGDLNKEEAGLLTKAINRKIIDNKELLS